MKRWLSSSLFVVVCSLVLTASAYAATAGFAGACSFNSSGTQLNCVFDASQSDSMGNPPSSCANNAVPSFTWNWGDNSSPLFTSNYFVSHPYPLPVVSGTRGYPYGYYVSLAVFCPEGSTTATRYICIYGFGFPGCINPNGSWY